MCMYIYNEVYLYVPHVHVHALVHVIEVLSRPISATLQILHWKVRFVFYVVLCRDFM